jgi:hypothetical protein
MNKTEFLSQLQRRLKEKTNADWYFEEFLLDGGLRAHKLGADTTFLFTLRKCRTGVLAKIGGDTYKQVNDDFLERCLTESLHCDLQGAILNQNSKKIAEELLTKYRFQELFEDDRHSLELRSDYGVASIDPSFTRQDNYYLRLSFGIRNLSAEQIGNILEVISCLNLL